MHGHAQNVQKKEIFNTVKTWISALGAYQIGFLNGHLAYLKGVLKKWWVLIDFTKNTTNYQKFKQIKWVFL